MEFRRPPLLYLNTYQLDPRTKFENEIVEIETNKILDETFTDHKYNDQVSSKKKGKTQSSRQGSIATI